MNCKNCGAQIKKSDPRCPYCNAMNYQGAESKYFKTLYGMKDDLSSLDKQPKRILKKHLQKVLAAILLFAVLLLGFLFVLHLQRGSKAKQEAAAGSDLSYQQLQWEEEFFPRLDAWYAKQEYDSILAFGSEQLKTDGNYQSFENWPHSRFLSLYEEYRICMQDFEAVGVNSSAERSKEDEKSALGFALDSYLHFVYDTQEAVLDQYERLGASYQSRGITAAERILIHDYRSHLDDYLYETLHMDKEAMDSLYQKCTSDGKYEGSPCFEFGDAEEFKQKGR